MADPDQVARSMWTLFEPVHAVIYFAPEARSAFEAAAWRPWARLGPAATKELAAVLSPLAQACAEAIPYPSPIGVPAPGIVT